MRKQKKKRLESKGWKIGTVKEFESVRRRVRIFRVQGKLADRGV